MSTKIAFLAAVAMLCGMTFHGANGQEGKVAPVLKFKMETIDGKTADLSKYQGKVVLIVNVASRCGLTPQYKGLQALHTKYAKDGLVVLGIPANDFGKQEPGTNEEIVQFCTKNYGVTFDMLAKVSVAPGENQAPLYKYLTSKETNPKFAGKISWNFEKFLIARDGTIVNRFAPSVKPDTEDFDKKIRAELEKK